MLHNSTVYADKNRCMQAKFICFMSLTILCLIVSIFIAIAFGAKDIHLQTVWAAFFDYNPKLTQHQIIYELRLPRVIGAAVIGAAFAVAGAVMQGVTRNPLADAGVLGINAGAMFVVALSFAFFPHMPYSYLMIVSFIGAVLSTILIFIIGSTTSGGLTPMRLTIAGAVMAAFLHSLSSGIAIYYDLSQDLAFWYAGGVAGVKWDHLKFLVPIIFVTIMVAIALGRSISLISMGDDVATNLGVKTIRTRIFGMVTVVILAGVSVSAVGSIGFVGLVIPHIARKLVGVNYRFIIPMSALLGAILLVLADLGARTVNPPKELAVGIMVALIGVPFFLYIASKAGREL
ncbi:iron ABC transporter permease [Bacillus sp. Xin]|uniref:FecCD family ABC transporter permease n=1 Tax=unclassified Bacillus (in: firmicutes) TaxID=185979 RepID=UPI001571ECA8|nr:MULTISPECIES: iron ABC transporter permease [unclassified Bacillus (in: firmicutes)]MBC6976045.1 iron ABC transporter permease [Bacillus sp. Xin]NSW38970.1 iron ABC transporter permease [Bacillus sp. Xin1]